MGASFSTAALPVSQQYDGWRSAIQATHHAWDMPPVSRAPFVGEVWQRQVGETELIRCQSDPCRGQRGRAELSQSSRATVGVLFVLSGRERLRHRCGDVYLSAGQLTLWDSTRPLAFDVPERLTKLTWLLPAAVAPPTGVLQRVFDGTRGCGALLLSQLRTLSALPEGLEPGGAAAAVRAALELLSATIRHPRDAQGPTARLVKRAEALIAARLDDPELTVATIAGALGVSRRHLDRAFAADGRSASRALWQARLERCHRDLLLEPGAGVSEIAFRWGFSDAAHFSRAFRRAYGTSPSQLRASASASASAGGSTARRPERPAGPR